MPLTFDLSWEELLTYQGTNPRPADYDTYWDHALAEMRGVDPRVELVPAAFEAPFAECFHMYFNGVGGARVHAKLLRPKRASALHPAVLIFHGYGGNSGDWVDKLPYVASGYTVAALDCRGQGGLSQDTGDVTIGTHRGHIIRGLHDALSGHPEKLLFRQIFLDTAELAKIVLEMPDVDADRVGVTGGSQGGALAIACAALEPRVRRAAPIFPFLSDYRRVWTMDQAKAAYMELTDYFRLFDPRHEREEQIFTSLGYVDIQFLAPRIKSEVLWGIGLMDTVCPPSSQFAAYNRIVAPKSLAVYPDFGHEALPEMQNLVYQFLLGL